ncbi:hypothetical protein HPB49_011683 [Dermacentor silvarum]|uniref:Uncharacterized protein n=1 Tax=Dermacentor silvarum TaxID=543639 RepID=A0ACB8DZV5_DERSI|nr:hypothetical protein HPB49_011683 [Dermacentor silvarum]
MLHRLVGDAVLSEVEDSHFGLDFNLVEGLAVVDTKKNGAGQIRHNKHVTQVSLDDFRLRQRPMLFLGAPQLLDESQRLALQTTRVTPPRAAVHQLHQLHAGHMSSG